MLLTVSKRLEFSASRRLFVREWSDAENLAAFGPETSARYGTGRNYVAYFVFSGTVDPRTGMLMNISEIKERVGRVFLDGFDHKFLNEDNPGFRQRSSDCRKYCAPAFCRCRPALQRRPGEACGLSPFGIGGSKRDLLSRRNLRIELLVRVFRSPPDDVAARFPRRRTKSFSVVAASPFGHGHNYRARLTFRGRDAAPGHPLAAFDEISGCMGSLHDELDHKNLNHEVLA